MGTLTQYFRFDFGLAIGFVLFVLFVLHCTADQYLVPAWLKLTVSVNPSLTMVRQLRRVKVLDPLLEVAVILNLLIIPDTSHTLDTS